jgi:aminomethyltransferase
MATTPLYDWHKGHGAKLVDFGGYDMPLWYPTGAVKEHMAVIQAAGLFDTSHMASISVSGPGAGELLQYAFTRDLVSLNEGRCAYGAFLDETGGAIDDAIVYNLGDDAFMVVVNAGMGARISEHLAGQKGFGDVAVEDLTGLVGKIDLQGPEAGRILAPLVDAADRVFGRMPYFSFKGGFPGLKGSKGGAALSGGPELMISRSGYTGEFGFELFTASDDLVPTWERILDAGESRGLIACGLAARDSLRAGAVLPLSHQDIGPWPFVNHPWPFALPYDQAGRFTKDFIGRRALEAAAPTTDHTVAYAGYDPRKVGEPAVVIGADGSEIGTVLTCVADMALGRHEGVIRSAAEPDPPEGFKARGLVCGFIKIARRPPAGSEAILKDARREIKVEIRDDVRPHRTARRPIKDMI